MRRRLNWKLLSALLGVAALAGGTVYGCTGFR
jgi:hypothetical protein